MSSARMIFAGVDISSGRRPVTFAALDGDLNVLALEKWDIPTAVAGLKEYDLSLLAINSAGQKYASYSDFKKKISQAGFKPFSRKGSVHQWIETEAKDCFRALVQQEPLPGRVLEGRIQRALVLYDEGLQIPDPMDFFEEITRHKLIQGILPVQNVYSSRQLDALVSAYTGWMTINRPGQIEMLSGGLVRPKGQSGD